MSQGQRPRSQRIRAKAAAEAAENGDLPLVNAYTVVQPSENQYRLTVPLLFMSNMHYGKGSLAGGYIDFQRGMVVYDFQTGDSYDRQLAGEGACDGRE
jgi:hypothetical protein